MKRIGPVSIAVAAVLLFAAPLETFARGPSRAGKAQLGRPMSGGKSFKQHRSFRGHSGFRQHRGFGQHQGFGQPHHFKHRGGPRHQPRFHFDHGGKRHHRGFKFFGAPPTIFVPPAVIYRPAPAYYWYYCTNPAGYYPYVTYCPGGWLAVVPH